MQYINKMLKRAISLRVKTFTLMEVVVSIAILAIGVVTALQITASGTGRMSKAVSRWKVQHMLTQAAEYYLIAGPNEPITEDFFPFDGYEASCEIGEPELEDGIESAMDNNWSLVKLTITITDDQGIVVGQIEMDKILRTDDTQ